MTNFRRPEHSGPPQYFYDEIEARKYTCNSRIISVQSDMTERALELLSLPENTSYLLLDLGCGSGISGEVISNFGHCWIGLDISMHMLDVARERDDDGQSGNLLLADLGHGISFRPGCFDGAISISALQWLCNADSKEQHPPKRLYRFFSALYTALARGARAVFQFYPDNSQQIELVTHQAMRAGFTGGLVIDFPNSAKAKKIFLVLFSGGPPQKLPKGLDNVNTVREDSNSNEVTFSNERFLLKDSSRKGKKFSKQWIMEKKEKARKQGKHVKSDSKYTGRKRKNRF